jgi:hypothetical protein
MNATGFRFGHALIAVLMQARRGVDLEWLCSTAFASLSTVCTSAISAMLAKDAGQEPTAPFGQDPAFNPVSALFSEDAVANISAYYNASAGGCDISLVGFPKGFYSVPFVGQAAGFPVLFPVRIVPCSTSPPDYPRVPLCTLPLSRS